MVDIEALKKEQLKLAKKVELKDSIKEPDIRLIAGVDQAYTSDNKIISAIVVLDYRTFQMVERKYAVAELKMPYIPGFLAYREAPVIIDAFSKLEKKPDVLMFDCNGILHPRRIGMASHVGISLDIPAIGVAKTLIGGIVNDGKVYMDDEPRAMLMETKEHAKPVYVSPGHKITLRTAFIVAKNCVKNHKLPEPLHQAHKYSVRVRKKMEGREADKGQKNSLNDKNEENKKEIL